MDSHEVLARMTLIGMGSLAYVLDDDGYFDNEKAKRTGGIHLLTKHETTRVTRHHKDGSYDVIETMKLAIDPPRRALEALGKHHSLWTGEEDPMDAFARLLGVPKEKLQIPSSFDPASIPGELLEGVELSDESRTL